MRSLLHTNTHKLLRAASYRQTHTTSYAQPLTANDAASYAQPLTANDAASCTVLCLQVIFLTLANVLYVQVYVSTVDIKGTTVTQLLARLEPNIYEITRIRYINIVVPDTQQTG